MFKNYLKGRPIEQEFRESNKLKKFAFTFILILLFIKAHVSIEKNYTSITYNESVVHSNGKSTHLSHLCKDKTREFYIKNITIRYLPSIIIYIHSVFIASKCTIRRTSTLTNIMDFKNINVKYINFEYITYLQIKKVINNKIVYYNIFLTF